LNNGKHYMKNRIKIDNDRLFPVQAFLNVIPDEYFIRTLKNLVEGIGATYNDVGCCFPGDLDPGDETFEGINFGVLNEEVVISRREFFGYLQKAAQEYIKMYPSDSEETLRLLKIFERSC